MSSTACEVRLSGVVPESITDGPGIRYVIFTQGCPHRCKGCHNPQTHAFDAGYFRDAQSIIDEIAEDPLLSGVTFSGGEPFCQVEALLPIAQAVKDMGKSLFVYTGYTVGQLLGMSALNPGIRELLLLTDTLVDGRFQEELMDLTLAFRGSKNQRLIEKDELMMLLNRFVFSSPLIAAGSGSGL